MLIHRDQLVCVLELLVRSAEHAVELLEGCHPVTNGRLQPYRLGATRYEHGPLDDHSSLPVLRGPLHRDVE
jgi:hypothetical protein